MSGLRPIVTVEVSRVETLNTRVVLTEIDVNFFDVEHIEVNLFCWPALDFRSVPEATKLNQIVATEGWVSFCAQALTTGR